MAAEKFTFAATLGVSYEMYVGIEVENGVFVLLLIYLKKKFFVVVAVFANE